MRLSILFILLLVACNERLDVKEEDMQKYPEILPFILDNSNFQGKHFLDPGWLHFNYNPNNNDNLIKRLDSIAIKEHWQIKEESNIERLYVKRLSAYPADTGIDSLFVKYDEQYNQLQFRLH